MAKKAEAEGRKAMTDEEAYEAARSKLVVNRTYYDDALNDNRRAAYSYYRGEMPGPTPELYASTIVSTDVSDTIEWVLPAILKPLVESPDVVRFDPVNPEDQGQADAESDYVHHVFMKKCDGFLKLYCHIKDALLLKNAVFCTYWDEGYTHQREEYLDQTEAQIAGLISPDDGSEVKIIQADSHEVPVVDVATGGQAVDPQTGAPMTEVLHDVVTRRFRKRGRPVVENCAPEAFTVDFNHNSISLTDVSWCAYSMAKPRAYLTSLGYDKEKIDSLPKSDSDLASYTNETRYAREDVERENSIPDAQNETSDPSQDLIDVHRVYMRMDKDGDGYEEQYIVILGGGEGQVGLDCYEVPENPFSASTPFIAAHKFYGYSLFDKLKQLANHKTKVLRMLEDNLDLQNNPRKKVLRGRANLNDVLKIQVGGVWRVDQVDAVTEVPTTPIDQTAHALLNYYDKIRTERSGVDPNAQSIAEIMPEESMNSAVERVLSAKEEIVGLMIRVFAETGIKDMFLKLRGLMMRYNPHKEIVQLRNKWTTINPGNWVERTNTSVVVGLGTGDRIRKTTGLQMVLGIQQEAVKGGLQGVLVSPERMAHTVSELIRVQGLGDPDDFVLTPDYLMDPRNQNTPRGAEMVRAMQLQQQQAQQAAQQQNAAAQQSQAVVQAQMQIAQMQEETKRLVAQLKEQGNQGKLQQDMAQFMEEMRLKWSEFSGSMQIDQAKEATKAGQAMLQASTAREVAVEQTRGRVATTALQAGANTEVARMNAEANEAKMKDSEDSTDGD